MLYCYIILYIWIIYYCISALQQPMYVSKCKQTCMQILMSVTLYLWLERNLPRQRDDDTRGAADT